MTQTKADNKSTETEDFDWTEYHQAHIKRQESDIDFMAGVFESGNAAWKSLEELDAWHAQSAINLAKQKIKALREEIEMQEAIILDSERTIRKFKRQNSSHKAGRPERSEEKERITKIFISQWVMSLMNTLEVNSCGRLEKMISFSTERNWRRWLKGDAIPTFKTFEKLLDTKIDHGKYAGEELQKVPSTPEHKALLTLLRFT